LAGVRSQRQVRQRLLGGWRSRKHFPRRHPSGAVLHMQWNGDPKGYRVPGAGNPTRIQETPGPAPKAVSEWNLGDEDGIDPVEEPLLPEE
jgi:hypothetical protein